MKNHCNPVEISGGIPVHISWEIFENIHRKFLTKIPVKSFAVICSGNYVEKLEEIHVAVSKRIAGKIIETFFSEELKQFLDKTKIEELLVESLD